MPGSTAVAGHGRWRGGDGGGGACCFAGMLRSPAGPGPAATMAEAVDPYVSRYASAYAGHPRTSAGCDSCQ